MMQLSTCSLLGILYISSNAAQCIVKLANQYTGMTPVVHVFAYYKSLSVLFPKTGQLKYDSDGLYNHILCNVLPLGLSCW